MTKEVGLGLGLGSGLAKKVGLGLEVGSKARIPGANILESFWVGGAVIVNQTEWKSKPRVGREEKSERSQGLEVGGKRSGQYSEDTRGEDLGQSPGCRVGRAEKSERSRLAVKEVGSKARIGRISWRVPG